MNGTEDNLDDREWSAAIQRKLRLVVLLDSAENAGLTPISILRLHTFAYLANVLAPVWDMPALDGKVLKRKGSPFYPALQHDLDRLVGMGVVLMSSFGYSLDGSQRWRLEGTYSLNYTFAARILDSIHQFEDEELLIGFIQELAYALSALSDEELDMAMGEDATYSDPLIDFGNVVDFAEWRQVNYSANAASRFGHLLPSDAQATLGEKLHFYVRHLRSRLHGGR
jgi:hypothetical protein